MDKKFNEKCTCQHTIVIDNLIEGETLNFSLALLKGEVSRFIKDNKTLQLNCNNHIVIHNSETNATTYWPVIKLKFKCLVELTNGKNKIVLEFCNTSFEIILNYKPRATEYFVTPVYIICKNHDGRFQAPVNYDNSVECACRRIVLGSKLIQSLIAEKLFENNFGRKTFQIESDVNLKADKCVRFYSNLTVEEARSMDQEALWVYFGRELMKSELCSNKRKFLAFLSATWWDGSDNGSVKAHAALGGGGLALFGTACLYTWPEHVEDVIKCFLDTTPVDTRYLMDDSCFRGNYGGCFSTTLGSVCHELGHTFDLGHSKDGIMGRGFDNIGLVFLPLAHYFQNHQQCMQYTTVQLISKLNVECFIKSPTTIESANNANSDGSCYVPMLATSSPSLSLSAELINNQSPRPAYSTKNVNSNNNNNNSRFVQQSQASGSNNGSIDDKTHWSPSCAALLAYHRWFNSESEATLRKEDIKYDKLRGVVMSSAGIRVVELRGENGLILHSWQFTTSRIKHQLVVPMQVAGRAELIVIEDSYGLLKKNHNFY
ncbi:uncharacterized protein LOC142324013 isoform X2 [Lycorma delicatula]|uniref:uncharacterized protein LOC142324013 isoform X2 n=1 Tax=Lycorma delicatula TaxID=130591 RepID=UPI003F512C7A